MFEQVMAGPRPWRFGHVHLPGGSTNLGTPAHMRCCMTTALFCCAVVSVKLVLTRNNT